MNEKHEFRILSILSYIVIVLSLLVSAAGFVMFSNLGRIGTELPVGTVDQFRNIANIMPLISELSSDLDDIRRDDRSVTRSRLKFTMNKVKAA